MPIEQSAYEVYLKKVIKREVFVQAKQQSFSAKQHLFRQ